MRKPLPFEAYEQALWYIYKMTLDVFQAEADEFNRIGVCVHERIAPYELIIEMSDDSCLILYEDMEEEMKKFWELRLEGEDGYYLTYKIGETKYTAFYGEKTAERWDLKFMKGFSLYDPKKVEG
jgi:hypothetical protein